MSSLQNFKQLFLILLVNVGADDARPLVTGNHYGSSILNWNNAPFGSPIGPNLNLLVRTYGQPVQYVYGSPYVPTARVFSSAFTYVRYPVSIPYRIPVQTTMPVQVPIDYTMPSFAAPVARPYVVSAPNGQAASLLGPHGLPLKLVTREGVSPVVKTMTDVTGSSASIVGNIATYGPVGTPLEDIIPTGARVLGGYRGPFLTEGATYVPPPRVIDTQYNEMHRHRVPVNNDDNGLGLLAKLTLLGGHKTPVDSPCDC